MTKKQYWANQKAIAEKDLYFNDMKRHIDERADRYVHCDSYVSSEFQRCIWMETKKKFIDKYGCNLWWKYRTVFRNEQNKIHAIILDNHFKA